MEDNNNGGYKRNILVILTKTAEKRIIILFNLFEIGMMFDSNLSIWSEQSYLNKYLNKHGA